MRTFRADFPKEQIPKCRHCGVDFKPLPIYIRTVGQRRPLLGLLMLLNDEYLIRRVQYKDETTLAIWSLGWECHYVNELPVFCSQHCARCFTNDLARKFFKERLNNTSDDICPIIILSTEISNSDHPPYHLLRSETSLFDILAKGEIPWTWV